MILALSEYLFLMLKPRGWNFSVSLLIDSIIFPYVAVFVLILRKGIFRTH